MLDDLLANAARHVELELSPQEYVALWEPFHTPGGARYTPYQEDDAERDEVHRLWKHLPKHTISRCPLCGVTYSEQVDTYNVDDVWTLGGVPPNRFRHQSFCEHFVGTQGFVHLNGMIPDPYYRGDSEVPYVMPTFLSDDPESYAVMHCLPVYRPEGNTFVPRYLLFAVTYYSQSPCTLQQKRDEVRFKPDKPLPQMSTWIEARGDKETWNLVRWVAEGKLWWLDLDQDDLPLKSGPVKEFPYANIEGIRKGFAYVRGELRLDSY